VPPREPDTGGAPTGGAPVAGAPLNFPPTVRSNRRGDATLAGVVGAVVIGLVALAAVVALRPAAADSPTQAAPPAGGAERSPGLGGEPVLPPDAGPIHSNRPSKPTRSTGRPARSAPAAGASVTVEPTTTESPKPTATATGTSPGNPYTPGQVCGSGYKVIDSASLTGPGGTLQGKVYLLYNAGNGNNCTVALKSTSVGTATAVSAYLEVQGGARTTDSGSYSYYAGPVRAKAVGVCVKWGGSAGGAGYNSPFEHCG
jgi:serine/threonine-protein kinase